MIEGRATALDGVAVLSRGDLMLVVYASAARLHRTRWLFDRADELVRRRGTMMALMVVLPTSDAPDAVTRAENRARLKRLDKKVSRLVTAAVGDSLRQRVVRIVMRGHALVTGFSKTHVVVPSLDEGVREVLAAKSADTPDEAQIRRDLAELHHLVEESRSALIDSATDTVG